MSSIEYVILFIATQRQATYILNDYDPNKESSYFIYWDVNNLNGIAMLQKLQVYGFEWINNTFIFNEGFIKNYN